MTRRLKRVIAVIMLALAMVFAASAQEDIYGNTTAMSGPEDINNILAALSPEELGITEARPDNINLEVKGSEATYLENTTPERVNAFAKDFDGNVTSELVPLLAKLLDGTTHGLNSEKSLLVYQATSIYANIENTQYVTKKTITFAPDSDKTNVRIMEIFPPEVLSNNTIINFTERKPIVFSQNPVGFRWELGSVSEGEEINITYYINNLIVGTEDTAVFTIADGSGPSRRVYGNISIGEASIEDKNNTINETGTTLTSNGVADNLIATSIVFVIILVIGIAVMELEGRGTFDGIKNIYRDAEAAARIGFKNRKIIDDYVSECVNKGYHLDDIRITLLRAGWNRKAVRRILEKYK